MSDIPELQRLQFFPGEMLTADDLTAIDNNNRQLRWLHNRSLHNWGIGFGLDVQGVTGGTSVTVSPGYATDSEGHEIVLSAPLTLPIPAINRGVYFLVADWVDDADEPVEQQASATACNTGGSIRLSDAPAILWKTALQLSFGTDVLLAVVLIENCTLNTISLTVRRYATCGSMFYLKAGELAAASLTWNPWTSGSTTIGLTAAIDTTAANFQSTPLYIAQIIGARSLETARPPAVVVDTVSVAGATPRGFTLQLAVPAMGDVNPDTIRNPASGLMSQLNWRVAWMGIEA